MLVEVDFDFVDELPLTVTPPDRLFPRSTFGGRVHEEHPRERGQILPRAMRPKGRHDRPLAVLADDGAQPLKRGNLRLMHGHQIAKALPKHHAANVADEWEAPGLTVAFGHSHRPGVHVKPGREGNCRAIAVGAGRTLDLDWMKGRPGGWEKRAARRVPDADGARRGLQRAARRRGIPLGRQGVPLAPWGEPPRARQCPCAGAADGSVPRLRRSGTIAATR